MDMADRFWLKVDKSGDCWPWTGARFKDPYSGPGYGMIVVNGQSRGAHRVAWELTNGPITDGLWVLHRCDNPPCVRPSHLYLGRPRDNSRDAVDRNRIVFGTRSHKAKLTEPQVLEIRRRWDAGATSVDLAKDYGVVTGTITHMVTGRNWKQLPGRTTRRGRNWSATLTNEQVAALVAEYRAGGITQAAIARRVGVSSPTVTRWIRLHAST